MPTGIEWCDETWSPVTGCSPVSTGCQNCWAKRMAKRLAGRFGYPKRDPFKVTLHPSRLGEPLRWRKPRRVFVCSMGDLFHEDVPDEFLYRVFTVMRTAEKHTFLLLTKRPHRLQEFMRTLSWRCPTRDEHEAGVHGWQAYLGSPGSHPIKNLWLGASISNQADADKNIPELLATPAAVRFISYEPGLGSVEFSRQYGEGVHRWCFCGPQREDLYRGDDRLVRGGIDWVICGAETGPGARFMDPEWAYAVHDQCQEAGVPFFYKKGSDGSRLLDGKTWNEFPERIDK